MKTAIEIELKAAQEITDTVTLLNCISSNAPDLLLEALDGLLQSFNLGESVTCNCDGLFTPTAGARFVLLKLGDEFIGRVAALGALYRERGFSVPTTFDAQHFEPPLQVDKHGGTV